MSLMQNGVLAASLILLCGCSPQKTELRPPVGRYQIVADPRYDGVFWIDTVTGETMQCQWAEKTWQCFSVKKGQ